MPLNDFINNLAMQTTTNSGLGANKMARYPVPTSYDRKNSHSRKKTGGAIQMIDKNNHYDEKARSGTFTKNQSHANLNHHEFAMSASSPFNEMSNAN